jgi:sugar-phosphatase
VIIDSNPAIEAFWQGLAKRENLEFTDEMIREWVHGRKAVDTVAGVFSHLTPTARAETLREAEVFDQSMKATAIYGVVGFISALHELGVPTGVVTSSHHSRMLQFLTAIGVQDKFTHFVTAHDVTQGKPHPQPYQKMSEFLDISPEDCLVFEDAVSGIQSAKAAGMQPVGIGNEVARALLISHGAIDVIANFTMLQTNASGISINGNTQFIF